MGVQAFAGGGFFDAMAIAGFERAYSTGTLPDVLHSLSQLYDERYTHQQEWRRLLRYPALMGVVVIGIIGLLGAVVLPNLETFLPEASKGFAYHSFKYCFHNLHVLGAACLLLGGLLYLMRAKIIHIPVVMRLCLCPLWEHLSFSMTHKIALLDALGMSIHHVTPALKTNVLLVQQSIEKGHPIDVSFHQLPNLPVQIRSLLSIAQQTGEMDKMMTQISQIEKNFRKNLINCILFWTQPILTLIIGTVLLWILYATLIPLYDSFSEFAT
jgi:type II secretory pathway component PulF